MLVRLRFRKEYPKDFSREEKIVLKNLIISIPNIEYKEYEFDSRKLNLFKFYTLLVDLGYKDIKLELEKDSNKYFMDLFKTIIFYDSILYKF